MPDGSLAQLRVIWQAAGRPGQAKLRDAAARKGLNLSVKQAADFVRAQLRAQVFSPAPRSSGKVTSPELNERWQCDLVDYKTKSPEKNGGNRLILVCVDVFSRFAYAELLKTKEAEEVAAAFARIQRVARGKFKGKIHVIPREVSTDTGAKFKEPFSEMLEHQGISQRFKESANSLAVADAATRTLKVTIAKEMVDNASDSWAAAVPLVVKAYNSNSHAALMNSAPEDVMGHPRSTIRAREAKWLRRGQQRQHQRKGPHREAAGSRSLQDSAASLHLG